MSLTSSLFVLFFLTVCFGISNRTDWSSCANGGVNSCAGDSGTCDNCTISCIGTGACDGVNITVLSYPPNSQIYCFDEIANTINLRYKNKVNYHIYEVQSYKTFLTNNKNNLTTDNKMHSK